MNKIEEKVLKDSKVIDEHIIKVDSFLNQQIDIDFMDQVALEFMERFKDKKIDKIVTAAVSGIAVATIVAKHFNVPMVFARKSEDSKISDDFYFSKVYSYTQNKEYFIKIKKDFLSKNENILIIDDFMANGAAAKGLIDLVKVSQANLVGMGVVIEKGFQQGGKDIRNMGVLLESLVIIESAKENKIKIKK